VFVAVWSEKRETLDDVSPLLVGHVVVNVDLPQKTVRMLAISSVTEGAVNQPRLEAHHSVLGRHVERMDVAVVDVDSHDGLSTPAVTLTAFACIEKVVTIEEATVEGETFLSDLTDEDFLVDVRPWFLDHLVAESAVEFDVSGLGSEADVVDLAE
jgi:hypothetical protein